MAYVDGFVIPVPRDRIADYTALAMRASAVWREHGALQVVECRADDVQPGKLTSFPQSVNLKDDEVVFFSWIRFSSREARDAINAKVMTDPRLADLLDATRRPFDATRMIFGGFEVVVDD